MVKYFIIGLQTILKFPFYAIKYTLSGLIAILTMIPKYTIIGFKYITEKKDPKKQNQNVLGNKFVPIVTITLSLVTYFLCVFLLTRWYVQNERNKKFADSLTKDILAVDSIDNNETSQYQDIIQPSTENSYYNGPADLNYLNVNLDYYLKKNSETVGWIKVNNTNINYPIVQHSDNSYYLSHDFYNRRTDIGWIFGDYRDNFDEFNNNTIIYGHNIVNRTMFGQIPYLLRKSWFKNENSHYIKLSTKKTNSIWQIFSVYRIAPTTDYLQSKFNSTAVYQDFLKKIKERSSQSFDVKLDYTDKIITLSTCDDIGTKRVVVHAKLIKIDNK